MQLVPDPDVSAHFEDPHFAIAFARIENHFLSHGAWLEGKGVVAMAYRLAEIPGTIVQGRYDMVCPPETAFDLSKAWPRANLEIVEGAGHFWSEPGIVDRLVRAADRYADNR